MKFSLSASVKVIAKFFLSALVFLFCVFASESLVAQTVSSVNFSTPIAGGNPVQATVTLSSVAPAGGRVVNLSSSNGAAAKFGSSTTSTVTVAAGQTNSPQFTITTFTTTTNITSNISATAGGVTKTKTLTVTPPTPSSVALSPESGPGGLTASGTVNLNGKAPSGGTVVTLSSSNAVVKFSNGTTSSTVTVAAGSQYANFPLTVTPVSTNNTSTITATIGTTSRTKVRTVTPPAAYSLSLNQPNVVSGATVTGTVTLNAPAPSGGTVVTLSSSNTGVASPATSTVTVAATSTSTTFTINTSTVTASTNVTISAAAGGSTQSAPLTVNPPIPTTPTNLTAVADNLQIKLTWTASTGTISDYKIYRRLSGESYPTTPTFTVSGSTTTYTNTGLSNGTQYFYVVKASNSTGDSANSNEASGTPSPLPVPTPFTATAGDSQVTLSWGAVPRATQFNIWRRSSAGSFDYITSVSNVTSWVDTGLINGEYYYYGINAENVGVSSSEFAYTDATPVGPPSQAPVPKSVTLNPLGVVGGNSATGTVTLYGPAPSGGTVVALTSSNASVAAPATATVTVPAGSVSQTFAVNSSVVSSETSANIRATVGGIRKFARLNVIPSAPNPPVNLTALVSQSQDLHQVELKWTAPAGTVQKYRIYRRTSSGTFSLIRTVDAPTTTHIDKGYNGGPKLTTGTTYIYYVVSVNQEVSSVPSNTVSAVIGMLSSEAPKGFIAVGQDAQVSLAWDPVPGASKYNLFRSYTYLTTISGTTTTYTDTGLTNGSLYVYELEAATDTGLKTNHSYVQAIPLAATTIPAAPTGLTASPGNASIVLNWTAPTGTFSTYKIFRSLSSGTYATKPVATVPYTQTTYTDTGLNNGTTYFYVVKAANAGGEGAPSNEASASAFGPPTGFKATPGNTKIFVTWNAYPGATRYLLWRQGNGSGYTQILDTPSATLLLDTGLTNGQRYDYQIKAYVGGLLSAAAFSSATPGAVTPAAPSVPQISAVSTTGLTATLPALPWEATSLTLQKRLSSEPLTAYVDVATNQPAGAIVNVTGLTSGESYNFRCVAVNSAGATPGKSVRVLVGSVPLVATWAAGDGISCGGIFSKPAGGTLARGATGRFGSYLATDWDHRYVDNLFDGVMSDTCSYMWSASGGSFLSGINTGQSVQWIAPNTPGSYTINLVVDDQNSINVASTDVGSRNDLARSYNDEPLIFSTTVVVP